jgi:hypothetical protein
MTSLFEPDVWSWWTFLCMVSAVNVLAWLVAATLLWRRQGSLPADLYTLRRLQLLLSAGYVFGCAYRSVFPVFDVPRLALFDTWLASAAVGRSVATVAELCFVAQWALLLHRASALTANGFGRVVSGLLVPLIVVAEMFSWYSVLTTSNLGHVVEESLWGLGAALLVCSVVAMWPRVEARVRPLLLLWCVLGAGYAAYMFQVDVPMYWARWTLDEAHGRAYLSLAQGLIDVAHRRVVSHRWGDWHTEVVWMSLYFSVAVWLSIALVHAPLPALRRHSPRRLPRAAFPA